MTTSTLRTRFMILVIVVGILTVSGIAVAQITPIYDVQYTTDPSGDSPMAGQVVTIEGVVTSTAPLGFYVADATGPWNAIFVYTMARGCGVKIGDEISVHGKVSEYFNLTEISKISDAEAVSCSILSSGNPVQAESLATGDVGQEQYEGVLVEVANPVVQSLEDFGMWSIDDGRSPLAVDDDSDYVYAPALGESLDSIIGTVTFNYDEFKLNPGVSNDIQSTAHVPHYCLRGDIVTMNDTMDVLEDGCVEILGDTIVEVSLGSPSGLPIVDVDGLIFPGLIDAHNHPQYNVLDHIPFHQKFQDRYEWRTHAVYSMFSQQLDSIWDFGGTDEQVNNVWKIAEARAMAAGTTMIQGSNPYSHYGDSYARRGIGVNNVGRHPAHAWSVTFPITYDDWDYRAEQYWNRFNIHLSEGISQLALGELDDWISMGLLDERTSIIHGVPYGPTEWATLASAGAHLIWSPKSNWVLYEATANVPEALAAGVNVALSVDWSESGSRDLLEELRFAQALNTDLWGGALSPEWMVKSVTRNAALALGIEDQVGQIAIGFGADLVVFPGDPQDPYEALIGVKNEDVMLTVVAGKPSYGDPALMAQFPFLENVEDLSLCGTPKKIAFAVTNHAIPESERTVADILSMLEAAYAASIPKICDFMGIDPCESPTVFKDDFSTSGPSMWSKVVQ